ncbi:MAG: oligosaccharide flippase family protein [Candidatus Kariarchaeaceae archaeon]|jgi:O-antigen/teichoic acid export membrane protein
MESSGKRRNDSKVSYTLEITNDLIYYIPAKILPAILNLLAITIFTHLLGPREYGTYSLIIVSISIVLMTLFAWLNSVNLRFVEEHRVESTLDTMLSTLIFTCLMIYVAFIVIAFIALKYIGEYVDKRIIYLHLLGLILLGAKAGYNLIMSNIRAMRHRKKLVVYSVLESIGSIVIPVTLITLLNVGADGIILGVATVCALLFSNELIVLKNRWKIRISNYSIKDLRVYMSYGIPLIGVGMGSLMLSSADIYLIKYYLNIDNVGIYSAAYSFGNNTIAILYTVLISASFPVVIQVFEHKGLRETSLLLTRITSIYFVLLLPALFGIIILSKDIVLIMLPDEFHKSMYVIPLISSGVFFLGMTNIIYFPFTLKKKTGLILVNVSIVVIINIILNIIFIPLLGIIGAAITTLISYLIYMCINWYISMKYISFKVSWDAIWKSVVASSIMIISILVLGEYIKYSIISLLIKLVLGIIVYFGIMHMLKEYHVLNGHKYIRDSIINRALGK